MKTVEISNPSTNSPLKLKAGYCNSFFGKFKGLMFRRSIDDNEGLLLVEDRNSILNTSIHMLFMFFDIAAIWINSENTVVDARLAKKWFPFYFPQKPAMYILECNPSWLDKFQIGDVITIKDA